jgi:hypothetical protein
MSPLEPLPDWIKSSNSNAFAEDVPVQDTDDLSNLKTTAALVRLFRSTASCAAFLSYHSIVIRDAQSVHCKNKDGNIIDTFRWGILMGYPSGARIKNDTTG